jgi:hypothetical protein
MNGPGERSRREDQHELDLWEQIVVEHEQSTATYCEFIHQVMILRAELAALRRELRMLG